MELQTVTLSDVAHGLVRRQPSPPWPDQENDNAENSGLPNLTFLRSSFIITSVAGITVLNTFGQSLLIVAIPQIARDLKIPPNLIQWPSAAGALTLGCLLLIVGAVADVVGNRPVFLVGCLLHLAFGVGCSLARTGTQLIAFRGLQGAALAFCMPTSVGIITRNFAQGKLRNLAFACFGGGNPVGVSNFRILAFPLRKHMSQILFEKSNVDSESFYSTRWDCFLVDCL